MVFLYPLLSFRSVPLLSCFPLQQNTSLEVMMALSRKPVPHKGFTTSWECLRELLLLVGRVKGLAALGYAVSGGGVDGMFGINSVLIGSMLSEQLTYSWFFLSRFFFLIGEQIYFLSLFYFIKQIFCLWEMRKRLPVIPTIPFAELLILVSFMFTLLCPLLVCPCNVVTQVHTGIFLHT